MSIFCAAPNHSSEERKALAIRNTLSLSYPLMIRAGNLFVSNEERGKALSLSTCQSLHALTVSLTIYALFIYLFS